MYGQKSIKLTNHEILCGSTRQNWAEGLIVQLPDNHDGRNSWLLNYGVSIEAEKMRDNHDPVVLWNDETNAAYTSDDLKESDKHGWFNIRGKLPEKDGSYMVFTKEGEMDNDIFEAGCFQFHDVTHWRPLIERPVK